MNRLKTLLVLFFLPMCFALGQEQEKEEQKELLDCNVFIEAGIGYMPRQNKVTTYTPTIKVGYEFVKRLSVF